MRRAVLIGGLFLLLASRTSATPTNHIMASGQNTLATIDTNGDGIPDMMDCHFMVTTDSMGNFIIHGFQDSHGTGGVPLRACAGQFMGNIDPSFPADTSIGGSINSSTSIPGGIGHLPMSFDGTFLPQGGGAGGGGAAAGGPQTIGRFVLTEGLKEVGSGVICDGLARVTLANGVSVAVSISMDTPGFIKVANLPFEKADLTGFVFKDVFVPKTNGVVNFALESDPNNILIQLLLMGTCGRGAPTLNEGNLFMLAVALLAGGAWMLGRRKSFYQALPLP